MTRNTTPDPWTAIAAGLAVGDTFESRSGAVYTVAEVDARGYTARRANGKTVRASRAKVLGALAYAEVPIPNAAGTERPALRLYDGGQWSGQWWVSLNGHVVAEGPAASPEAGRVEAVRAARRAIPRRRATSCA